MNLFAETINDFHLNLFRQLCEQDKSLIYSPISTLIALGMTYTGADGDTKKILKKVLFGDNMTDDVIQEEMAHLISFINLSDPQSYELFTANRMYCQQNYAVLQSFKDNLSKLYSSEIIPVDITSNGNLVRQQVNNWVASITKNRIKDIIPVNAFNEGTRILLINAIYFKGFWANSFDHARTVRQHFYVNEETTLEVEMMNERNKNFLYHENNKVQVLAIPYRGNQLCMYFFLPREKFGLNEFEKNLTGQTLVKLIKAVRKCEVAVQIPKFRMEGSFDFKSSLECLKLDDIFTSKADFSKISADRDLRVTNVFHKAFIEITEEGCEAAAATAVLFSRGGRKRPADRFSRFTADHPFLWAIGSKSFSGCLFFGRYFALENV